MERVEQRACFGGSQEVWKHTSDVLGCEMNVGVYLPPDADRGPLPVLYWLSGLTCTEQNFITKAGAQRYAAEHNLILVAPDTSPRGEDVADDEAYDLGKGAGFYVNATEDPWAPHFQMYSYITDELQKLVTDEFQIDADRQGITGHSMGGHGALTLAMRNPELYKSVSAFAPIANPTASDWGRKQLSAYLGDDEEKWVEHDATLLLQTQGWQRDILVDQGASDQFLDLLKPEALSGAMAETRTAGTFRMQAGYDHSYFFVASFMRDHIAWHADRL